MGITGLVRAAATAIALSWSGIGSAQTVMMPDTGNGLLTVCTSDEMSDVGLCYGYIMGAIDGILLQAAFYNRVTPFCPPANATNQQKRDVILKFLRAHPESRHQMSAALLEVALHEAFPCPAK